jgi:hypothetical protein
MQIPGGLKTDAMLIGIAVVGLVIVSRNLQGLTAGIVGGAADIIVEAGTGAVIGVGDIIGVPRTNDSECVAAMKAGRSWDASFACPAGTYLNYMLHGYIDTNNKGLQ